jgi:hypothetical protein
MLNRYWLSLRWGSYDSTTYWYKADEYAVLVADYAVESLGVELTGIAVYDMVDRKYLQKWGEI